MNEAFNNLPHGRGLYNNDAQLFRNSRAYYRERGVYLVVVEGHIHAGASGYVARCQDDAEAEKILLEAGYTKDGGTFKP